MSNEVDDANDDHKGHSLSPDAPSADEYEEEWDPAIVIDIGSATIKAGLAGDDTPRTVIPSIVTRAKSKIYNNVSKDAYFGDDAQSKANVPAFYTTTYPVEHGIITNWVDMEMLWHHTFYNELRISPEEHSVLLTEPSLNPKGTREKMTQIMFESFKVPAFYVENAAVSSLYASGRTTGCVLDSGYSKTHSVPVYEGYTLPHAVGQLHFGGEQIDEYLAKILRRSLTTAEKREIIKNIKERLCCVAMEDDGDISSPKHNLEYQLPDGRKVVINGSDAFKATECIFKPDLVGIDEDGVHTLINNTILKSDVDIRKELYDNIVCCGGNTMFDNFARRLQKEMRGLVPYSMKFKIIAPPGDERKYSQFMGGSILAALPSFREMWVIKDEYDECGPSIVHRKCT